VEKKQEKILGKEASDFEGEVDKTIYSR